MIGAGRGTIAAKDAPAQVKARSFGRELDGLAGTDIVAGGAAVGTFALLKNWTSAELRRQLRLFRRIGHRAVTLSGARQQGFEHVYGRL